MVPVAKILPFALIAAFGMTFFPACRPAATRSLNPTPVIVIVFENETRTGITPTAAPYLTAFANAGRKFTDYNAIEHPSLPNYLDMMSGGNQGCHDDECPRQSYGADNFFNQVGDWQSWEESMPTPCALQSEGTYAVKHNPAAYFTDLAATCPTNDIAFPSSLPSPHAFTFITPNLCSDMHDCSVRTGDNWAKAHVPDLLAQGDIVVITFDEGAGSAQNIYAAVRGPGLIKSVDAAPYDHYSLLAGLEDHFGLPRLGNALGAPPLPIG